jgi:hypothetical protein
MNTTLSLQTRQPSETHLAISLLWKMVLRPVKTSREIAQATNIAPSLAVVAGYGLLMGMLFGISALARDYPPPTAELHAWIRAWGEFAMLPFLKIPTESYRLFLAFAMLPIALAAWILMSGSASFLSILFGGKATYTQWLNLTCFSFFPFLILASGFDLLYSSLLGDFIVPALQLQYGPAVQNFFLYFPMVMYPVLLTSGGIYTAISARQVEGFPVWKSAVTGIAAFAWTTLLWSALLR